MTNQFISSSYLCFADIGPIGWTSSAPANIYQNQSSTVTIGNN